MQETFALAASPAFASLARTARATPQDKRYRAGMRFRRSLYRGWRRGPCVVPSGIVCCLAFQFVMPLLLGKAAQTAFNLYVYSNWDHLIDRLAVESTFLSIPNSTSVKTFAPTLARLDALDCSVTK